MTAEQVVRDFFDALAVRGNLKSAFDTYLAEDCVWSNTGLPTAEGRAACHAFLDGFIANLGLDAIEVDCIDIGVGANGGVLTERVDRFINGEGQAVGELPVSGTLVVAAGKIVAWRDYFDPSPFLAGS